MNNIIYFDNSATTALAPYVFAEMSSFFLEDYGNPNSAHILGERAGAAVSLARFEVAKALGENCRSESIFFTSGGTESDNWAIRNALSTANIRGPAHFIASAVEHKAVLATLHDLEKNYGCEFTLLPVDGQGRIDPEDIRKAVQPNTKLVSVMAANNETGVIQPFEEAYFVCKELGVTFHCDAVQAFGKIPLSASKSADLISISAHKINGPKGVGALYVRPGVVLTPMIYGGAQESGLRGGTTPTPLVVGLGAAASSAVGPTLESRDKIEFLGLRLEEGITSSIPNVIINVYPAPRLPGLVNVCFKGLESHLLVKALSRRYGICCSSGSACSEKNTSPSYVLRACGLSVGDCHASVRFSLGRYNTLQEVDYLLKVLPPLVQELRKMSF